MGILGDIGVVSNGKLTKGTFAAFINDVNRRLRTGKGIFSNATIAKEGDPVPYSYISKIEDILLYPQFYQIWYARYDKMVKQLDLPGSFQLASKGAPIADPTALAAGLGASPPEAKFPDIVSEMQGLIPPGSPSPIPPPTILDAMTLPSVKSLDYFNRYMKSLNPLDPSMLGKLTKLISMPAAPPVAQQPDPRLLQYGYVQQHYFEAALFKAHRTAQQTLMSLSATSLPPIVGGMASGGGCDELLKFVYDVAAKSQPTPMSTSSFEIAAQEILLQHQVRYQCATVLGQNIGSGAVVKSLASSLPADGGLGVVNSSTVSTTTTVGGGGKATEASVGNGGELTDVSASSNSAPGAGGSEGDLFGFGAPSDDVAPPGTSLGGGPTGENFGVGAGMGDPSAPPEDVAPPVGKDPGGPSNTSNFGFGEPGGDLPPPQGGGANLGGTEAASNYGFGAPPDDLPPGGYVQGNQGGPSQFEQPPDDLPPPGTAYSGGSSSGLGGFGGEPPPDVGDEGGSPTPPYTMTPGIDPTEQGVETNFAEFNPAPGDDDGPDPLPKPGTGDPATIASIPPGSNPNVDGDDEDNAKPSGAAKGAKTKIRKRALKLLTAALGELPPNYESSKFGQLIPLIGIQGNVVDPRWGEIINKNGETFRGRTGSGFATKAEIDDIKDKNPKATSCGGLAGWLLDNLLFANGQPEIRFDNTQGLPNAKSPDSVSSWDAFVQNEGFRYTGNQIGMSNNFAFSNRGFGTPGYVAAMLGAWVSAENADPVNFRLPKYGDVFLIRDGNGDLRHIGTFIEVNPQQGYCVTADSGQGSISDGSQGMSYLKRNWKTGSGGGILMTGELHDKFADRILLGYIDIDLLAAGIKRGYGYSSFPT